jgi:uncharacterized protein YndB with AHSA1/START domain
MTMTASYHIDAPVEKVFDFFKDPASGDGTFGMEIREAKATEQGVGTYVGWRMKIAGIPWEGFEVITDCTPNTHITEKSSSAVVGTWEYSFEPDGAGTKVTLEHRPRALWALPPLGMLVDFTTTRMTRRYIRRVKQRLETRPSTAKGGRKPTAGAKRRRAASA